MKGLGRGLGMLGSEGESGSGVGCWCGERFGGEEAESATPESKSCSLIQHGEVFWESAFPPQDWDGSAPLGLAFSLVSWIGGIVGFTNSGGARNGSKVGNGFGNAETKGKNQDQGWDGKIWGRRGRSCSS